MTMSLLRLQHGQAYQGEGVFHVAIPNTLGALELGQQIPHYGPRS
jgi:hypothetical protein